MTVPNEFTACEEYRGFIIATRAGNYVAFRDGARWTDPAGTPYRRDTRAQMRHSIDSWMDKGRVA